MKSEAVSDAKGKGIMGTRESSIRRNGYATTGRNDEVAAQSRSARD
jgi:hypothetical protein